MLSFSVYLNPLLVLIVSFECYEWFPSSCLIDMFFTYLEITAEKDLIYNFMQLPCFWMMKVSVKRWHDLCDVAGIIIKTPDNSGRLSVFLSGSAFFFSLTDTFVFFVRIAQEDTSPRQTEAQGSLQSFCPHISRQKSLCYRFCGDLGTSGAQSHSCHLSLGLNLGLGLWQAEPESLGNRSRAHFLSLVWAM